ncbi:MerR family transcriptional regulator [Govanella unica]|uniref:MerR family transcriptional regulator n=1 Tax=Govanella unica TaxID=2975056 RepID=A0A9X3Z7F0_9PROT|nr:MerR family transcriptional regulator [Govania unica]
MESGRKAPGAFRTISEVAEDLGIPQHVLRFWESKFAQIKPIKRGGGRRYYRPEDIDLLRAIQALLYDDKYTIKGAQQLIREQGVRTIIQTFGGFAGAAAQNAEFGIRTQLVVAEPLEQGLQNTGLMADLRDVLQELEAIQAALLAPAQVSSAG